MRLTSFLLLPFIMINANLISIYSHNIVQKHNLFNNKKIKKIKIMFDEILFLFFYGIDLLYNFPSNASLYISATYGFFPGVSAPSSTKRA